MNEELDVVINNEDNLNINIDDNEEILNAEIEKNEAIGGTTDYEQLSNKPKINSVELVQDKSFEDLGLSALTNIELENILK